MTHASDNTWGDGWGACVVTCGGAVSRRGGKQVTGRTKRCQEQQGLATAAPRAVAGTDYSRLYGLKGLVWSVVEGVIPTSRVVHPFNNLPDQPLERIGPEAVGDSYSRGAAVARPCCFWQCLGTAAANIND